MSRALWAAVLLLVAVGMLSVAGRGAHPGDFGRRVDPVRRDALSALGIRDPRIAQRADEVAKFDERFEANPVMTLLHVLPGGLVLLLAPLQFSARMRSRHLSFHRWSGRLLITAGLVAALTGFYFGVLVPYGGIGETAAIALFGGLFVFALLRAFFAIRSRQVALHREWMIRAVAVVLGVPMVRVAGAFLDVALTPWGIPPADLFVLSLWTGWGLSLLAGELWIRRTRARGRLGHSGVATAPVLAASRPPQARP